MHPHSPSHSNLGPLLMAIASLGLILFAAGSGKRSQSSEKNTPPQGNAKDLHSDGTSDPHPSGTESRSGSGGWSAGSAGPAGKPVESNQSTAGASPQQEAYAAPSIAAAGTGNGAVMSAPLAEPTSQKPTATDPSISSDNVETVSTSVSTPSKSPGNTR